MSKSLRLGLVIAAVFALLLVFVNIKRKKLNIKYSIVWMLWSMFSLFLAIFPKVFYEFAYFVGIELPVNAVFLIMIGLLYALTFYSYIMISKHNDEIIKLTYEVASLKKEIEDLKNK